MCVKFAVRSHKYLFERKRFSYKTFFKKYDRSINGTIILKNLATLLPIEQDISSFLFVVTNIWGISGSKCETNHLLMIQSYHYFAEFKLFNDEFLVFLYIFHFHKYSMVSVGVGFLQYAEH